MEDDEAEGLEDVDDDEGGDGAAAAAASGSGAAGADGTVPKPGRKPPQMSAKKQQKAQLAREIRELKLKRLQKLAEMKQEAESRQAKGAADAQALKLEFLMKQAAVYTHFVPSAAPAGASASAASAGPSRGAAAASSSGGAAGAGGGRRGGKHAMNAKDEDEELNAEAAEIEAAGTHTVVKLTKQPAILTGGTLREYQVRRPQLLGNIPFLAGRSFCISEVFPIFPPWSGATARRMLPLPLLLLLILRDQCVALLSIRSTCPSYWGFLLSLQSWWFWGTGGPRPDSTSNPLSAVAPPPPTLRSWRASTG